MKRVVIIIQNKSKNNWRGIRVTTARGIYLVESNYLDKFILYMNKHLKQPGPGFFFGGHSAMYHYGVIGCGIIAQGNDPVRGIFQYPAGTYIREDFRNCGYGIQLYLELFTQGMTIPNATLLFARHEIAEPAINRRNSQASLRCWDSLVKRAYLKDNSDGWYTLLNI